MFAGRLRKPKKQKEQSRAANTLQSFKDKWEKNERLAFSETLRANSEIFNWILKRNGFNNPEELKSFLRTKRRILDAGCGNGRITALLRRYSEPRKTEIVGIDMVSTDIARKNLAGSKKVKFFEKNILNPLNELGKFDFIYCQEVLHHTEDPQGAFLNLCELLMPGGEIAIYVYKKKAPIREFTDDYVRQIISDLPYRKAMKVCDQITELGRSLSAYKITIQVPQVDALKIEKGEYDLQRFIYHFFMKCFWNPALSFQDNSVINYDWYHPQLCSRHTVEEVQNWFQHAGLTTVHKSVDFYGITIRGQL